MSDVFISYSRQDIAFARILHKALKDNEFETWIDWQDIPPSTDWLAEVYEAIEQADTFIFVISHSSIESEICGLEIAHAAKNNKRLIPIVVNEVEPQKVHPSLAALNWIFFREHDEFSGAFQDLIEAIQTDYDWVKEHTRLQVRALEWDREEREGGYLLRGGDLDGAERWLAQAAAKDPQPTALHTQYILASRQAATRRQRVTLGAVLVGLVIAIGLGVLAWTQRNQAVYESHIRATAEVRAIAESTRALNAEATAQAERATAQAESTRAIRAESTAVAEAAIARSRQLAANSTGQLDVNHDLALLLAIEARRSAGTGEAKAALRESLVHRGRTLKLLYGHTGAVFQAVWNDAGTRIVTASADGTARIWDAEIGRQLILFSGHTESVNNVAWNPGETRIVTASDDGTARVWDAETGAELVILSGHADAVNHVAWNPDGTRVVTASDDGTARVWDAKSGQEIVVLSGDANRVKHAAWNADGTLIVTSSNDAARVWDVETGRELARLLPDWAGMVYAAWNKDGTRIVTGETGVAQVWDIAATLAGEQGAEPVLLTGHEHAHPVIYIGTIPHAAWNENETRILSVCSDTTVEIWDAENGQTLASLYGHTDAVNTGAWRVAGEWDAVGPRVVTASDDGTARVWDAESGQELIRLTGHTGAVNHASWNRGGTRIVTASADGTARVWSAEAVEELAAFPCSVQEHAAWNPEGTLVITGGYGSQMWDVETGEELTDLPGDYAAWNPAGVSLLTTHDDGTVRVWDVSTLLSTGESGAELVVLAGHAGGVRRASWNPAGTQILTICFDGTMRVWDAESGAELTLFSRHPDRVLKAAWSPDGTRIVSIGKDDNMARMWDAASGAELVLLSGHTDEVQHAAWSPDGARLVTASLDGTARVWDAESGQEQLLLSGSGYAAWSPDGTRIVTSGGDLVVWDSESGTEMAVLSGHTSVVDFAAWNPDGTVIATASWDATARVWDAESGAELAVIGGYFDQVRHAAWSPDGARLVITSWGGPARMFDVPLVDMLEKACLRAVRNMSEEEWARYLGGISYRETCAGKPVPGRDYELVKEDVW